MMLSFLQKTRKHTRSETFHRGDTDRNTPPLMHQRHAFTENIQQKTLLLLELIRHLVLQRCHDSHTKQAYSHPMSLRAALGISVYRRERTRKHPQVFDKGGQWINRTENQDNSLAHSEGHDMSREAKDARTFATSRINASVNPHWGCSRPMASDRSNPCLLSPQQDPFHHHYHRGSTSRQGHTADIECTWTLHAETEKCTNVPRLLVHTWNSAHIS